MKPISINTGDPRNLLGHVISGAVASALVSGTINYKKLKERKIRPQDALSDTIKKTSQGAIATGCAIATANYIGQKGGLLKALSAISIGMAGIYALEIMDDKLKATYIKEDDKSLIEGQE